MSANQETEVFNIVSGFVSDTNAMKIRKNSVPDIHAVSKEGVTDQAGLALPGDFIVCRFTLSDGGTFWLERLDGENGIIRSCFSSPTAYDREKLIGKMAKSVAEISRLLSNKRNVSPLHLGGEIRPGCAYDVC